MISSAPPLPTLRDRLRIDTATEHAALESALPITREWVDERIYRDHLRFLLGFHEPMERSLQHVNGLAALLPDVHRRWKSPLLCADLTAFAVGPRADSSMLPQPAGAAAALGVLYVLDGATLGARSLLPRLQRQGVLSGAVGSRYLHGYGPDTARMWRRLCAVLNGLPTGAAADTIDAARQAFSALLAWRRIWETAHE